MIKKIILDNIQSHEHTEVELNEGVNSIVGSSCAGKTAILRAFYWVVENRPSGTSILCSNWNKDKKGNLIKEMSATIVTDDGWVKRYRNNESNGYIIHYSDGIEHKLEAVKTDVPEEVSKFLNINDVNIQKQMDNPFLLSNSAGESARYLNSIVHLDSIDDMLSKAEKNRRDVNSNIKFLQEDIESKQKELEVFEKLNDAVSLCSRVEKFDNQISETNDIIDRLKSDLEKFDVVDYSNEISLVTEIDKLNSEILSLRDSCNCLTEELEEFESVKNYDEEIKLVKEIESIVFENTDDLSNSIDEYEHNLEIVSLCEKEIEKLKSQLPNTCPVCGKPLDDCEGD